MKIDQDIIEAKIRTIVHELGMPTAEQMAELRRLLPPVDQHTPTPVGNLRVGGRRRR